MKKICIVLLIIVSSSLYAPDSWRWVETDIQHHELSTGLYFTNLTNECKLDVYTNSGAKISCDNTGATDYAGIQGAISVCFKNGSVVFQQFGPFIVHQYCKQLIIPGQPLTEEDTNWLDGKRGIYLGNKNPLGKF